MAMQCAKRPGVRAIHRRFGHVLIRVEKQSVATPSVVDSADPAQHRSLTRPKKRGDESHALPRYARSSGSLRLAIFTALQFQNAPCTALTVSLLRKSQ